MKPSIELSRLEVQTAIQRVIDKSKFILGSEVESLEKEFASYVGTSHAIGVASGTDALTISLMALGIGPKDIVMTVANSAPATVTAIRRTGARVRFIDVDENGLMNPSKITEQNLYEAKAIVPVHLYGRLADINRIADICGPKDIYIVEDACQAHGSSNLNYRIGERSAAACFSFYPTKNLGCYGDGGAIATNNGWLANRIKCLRNYGLNGSKLESYGLNSRLDEIQAAILRVKLNHLEEITAYKIAKAQLYHSKLRDLKHVRVREHQIGDNHHIYPVFAEDRNHLQKFLMGEGIQTAVHYPVPAHKQPCEPLHPPLPVTEHLCSTELSLPIWYGIGQAEVEHVCHYIRKFYAA